MPGPMAKPSERRARRQKTNDNQTILRFEPAPQPELPSEVPWPEETLAWWKMWGDSPQAELFSSTDWSFLIDTALLHAELWGNGNTAALAELRIRQAKFGATIADRAALRITLAEADDRDAKRPEVTGADSRQRRGTKKVIASVTDISAVKKKA